MLIFRPTTQFKKDYKLAKKRGYDISLLEEVIDKLLREIPLEEKYKDHALIGNYLGFRECHIQSDWLLIYAINHDELILTVSRTGTHSDLLRK